MTRNKRPTIDAAMDPVHLDNAETLLSDPGLCQAVLADLYLRCAALFPAAPKPIDPADVAGCKEALFSLIGRAYKKENRTDGFGYTDPARGARRQEVRVAYSKGRVRLLQLGHDDQLVDQRTEAPVLAAGTPEEAVARAISASAGELACALVGRDGGEAARVLRSAMEAGGRAG